jgi:hypothetical protein
MGILIQTIKIVEMGMIGSERGEARVIGNYGMRRESRSSYFTSARLCYYISALWAGIVEGRLGSGVSCRVIYLLRDSMRGSGGNGIGGGGLKDDSESKSGLYDKGQIHPTKSLHRIIYQPPRILNQS